MKDYYKILGLYEEASQEEIRERWAELTRTYHPDRGIEEDDERIKEINEAYQVLKDPATRSDYDFNRDLKKSVLRKAEYEKRKKKARISRFLPPVAIGIVILAVGSILFFSFFSKPQGPTRKAEILPIPPIKSEASIQIGKDVQPTPPEKPAGADVEKAVPEPSVPVPQLPPSKEIQPKVSIPPVVKPEEPPRVAKEIVREPAKRETAALAPALREPPAKEKAPPAVVTKPTEPPRVADKPVRETTRQETVALAPKLREPPARVSPPAVSKPEVSSRREETVPVAKEVPKAGTEKIPPKPAPAEPARLPAPPPAPKPVETVKPAGETLREPIRTVSPEKPLTPPMEMAKIEIAKPAPSETPRPASPPVPAPAPTPAAKPEEPPKVARDIPREPTLPPIASEEEVIRFLAQYVNQYVGKNVDGLLSFFSPQAVQNQRFDYNAIKRMYGRFFEESQKLSYRVTPQAIDISPREARVRGTYLLEQETKSGENKLWRGNIEWTLIREQGTLKVRTLQYQHTQKP